MTHLFERCTAYLIFYLGRKTFHGAAEVYPVKNIDKPGDGRMSIAIHPVSDTQDVGYKFTAI